MPRFRIIKLCEGLSKFMRVRTARGKRTVLKKDLLPIAEELQQIFRERIRDVQKYDYEGYPADQGYGDSLYGVNPETGSYEKYIEADETIEAFFTDESSNQKSVKEDKQQALDEMYKRLEENAAVKFNYYIN